MLITSKNPNHVAREVELRNKAIDYEYRPIERILWKQGALTMMVIGRGLTKASVSDIYLPRVRWMERFT